MKRRRLRKLVPDGELIRRRAAGERLRELAPQALVGLAGRPYEAEFLRAVGKTEEMAPRVVRFTRAAVA